jgi:cytochrome bd-type quinol oxidase subunit 2
MASLPCPRDPTNASNSWPSTVLILEDEGPIAMQARQLGRTSMLLEGAFGLVVGRAVTIELEVQGEQFQVLAQVEASILAQGVVLTLLRFGATSPRGNDLIAATVKRALPLRTGDFRCRWPS